MNNILRCVLNLINFWVSLTINFILLVKFGYLISVFSGVFLQADNIKSLTTVNLITYWFIPYLFTTLVLVFFFIKYLILADKFFLNIIVKFKNRKNKKDKKGVLK